MINLARGFYRTSAVLFILILLVAASSSVRVTAATMKTLFSYCPQQNCSDGREPNGAFVADSSGNLIGTTLANLSARDRDMNSGCFIPFASRRTARTAGSRRPALSSTKPAHCTGRLALAAPTTGAPHLSWFQMQATRNGLWNSFTTFVRRRIAQTAGMYRRS